MKFLFQLVFFLIFLSNLSFGQIKGKIVDKDGVPIEFVNVFLQKAPNQGCATNSKGEFSLTITQDFKTDDTLIISHLAYKIKKIAISKNKDLNIELFDNEIQLNEVIVMPTPIYIKKIIEHFSQNYPSNETFNRYNLIYQNFTNDSTILGYFNGSAKLIFSNYIGNKKHISGFISDSFVNINKYKKIPDFSYKTPSSIFRMIFPENLPFLKKFEDYDFEVSFERDNGVINFKPKTTNKFMYQGLFYFDIKTFAIQYVKMKLIYHKDNKDMLISFGFRKSSTYTNYNKEEIEIFYSTTNSEKLEVEKMSYKSATAFENKSIHYDINTKLYLIREDEPSVQLSNLSTLNLYSLKTSKKGVSKNRPFLDPILKKAIEEIIKSEEK